MSLVNPQNLQRLKFLFDLHGYVIVRNVLDKDELDSANRAIDLHEFQVRSSEGIRNASSTSPFGGGRGRMDMGGMLGWSEGQRDVFRKCLAHPNLVSVLHELLGTGYRLDHSPLVIGQEKGSEGFELHGGSLTSDGKFIPELQYRCKNETIYNTLLGVSFQLSGQQLDEGGYCVVGGSHKINFPPPKDIMNGSDSDFFRDYVHQPVTNPGDVILFSEATIHGCLPWKSDRQRRIALYRFSPSHLAFARGYTDPSWPASFTQGLTEEQAAVILPPYLNMYDRPYLDENGKLSTVPRGRSQAKKDFDNQVFGARYY